MSRSEPEPTSVIKRQGTHKQLLSRTDAVYRDPLEVIWKNSLICSPTGLMRDQSAERQVLQCLRALGGKAINNEIAEHLGCRVNASSPRMRPLEKKGLVRRTKERRNRQIVWELGGESLN